MDDQTKNKIIKEIIRRVILNTGESHRLVVQEVLDEEFINFCIDFFKKIVDKKLSGEPIDVDWYKNEFLNEKLSKEDGNKSVREKEDFYSIDVNNTSGRKVNEKVEDSEENEEKENNN